MGAAKAKAEAKTEVKTLEVVGDGEKRASYVRSEIKEIKHKVEMGYVSIAGLFLECQNNAYYLQWGYDSLREYCEDEAEISYRVARYLINIAIAIKEYNLPIDRVISIGWTKMRYIAPLLTHKTAGQWLDQAESMTAKDIAEMTKGASSGATVESLGTPKILRLTLTMSEDEASIIMDAINRAKDIIDTDSTVSAMEIIAYDWIQQSAEGPKKTELEVVIKWIKKVYGVDMIPEGSQDVGAMLNEKKSNEDSK